MEEKDNSSHTSDSVEEESILSEFSVQKEFLWWFRKKYDLIITDTRIVLVYKGGDLHTQSDIKRSISYPKLKGITKSTHAAPACFILHCKNTEDELLFCDEISGPIEMIKKIYVSLSKKNLPIFGKNTNDLTTWMTTYKDALIGISRIPLKRERIKSERILTDESSSDDDEEEKELFNDFFLIDREECLEALEENDEWNNPMHIDREKQNMQEGISKLIFTKNIKKDDTGEDPASLEDFEVLKVIDKGSFGKVFLVRSKENQRLYAMKRIRKDILIEKGQVQNTKNEKEILLNIEHPFLLGMDFVFENDHRLYFFLDYVKGGNLFESLFTIRRFPENMVKFIAAQLVLAIGCLHENKIVHRDLKPENVLLEEDGYIKLADFGLAKFLLDIKQSTYSFCGTAEYLAPEILEMKGHDFSVDWWTLGILIYELRVGRPPFLDKNHQRLGKLIKKGKIIFPDPIRHKIDMSEDLKDLILKLLDRNPKTRIGGGGHKEILEHPWFADLDFDAILNKEVDAPYKPDLKKKVKNPNSHDYKDAEEMRETETILEDKAKDLIENNVDKFAEF